jgi:hypothetical protein
MKALSKKWWVKKNLSYPIILFPMLRMFFFLEKKEPKIQEKTIPSAQATRHRVFSSPTHSFISDLFGFISNTFSFLFYHHSL